MNRVLLWFAIGAYAVVSGCGNDTATQHSVTKDRGAAVPPPTDLRCVATVTVEEACARIGEFRDKVVCLRFSSAGELIPCKGGYGTELFGDMWATENEMRIVAVFPVEAYAGLTRVPSVEWNYDTGPRLVSLHEIEMQKLIREEKAKQRNKWQVYGILRTVQGIGFYGLGWQEVQNGYSWEAPQSGR